MKPFREVVSIEEVEQWVKDGQYGLIAYICDADEYTKEKDDELPGD